MDQNLIWLSVIIIVYSTIVFIIYFTSKRLMLKYRSMDQAAKIMDSLPEEIMILVETYLMEALNHDLE